MEIIELIIDEEMDNAGIDAVSLVSEPAIMESFIALSKQQEIKLAEVDSEKRILMGAALVPGRMIYRNGGKDKDGYYVHFSEATVRRASELFFIKSNHINATLEHDAPLEKMTIVESWIIEDPEVDKSKLYGMSLPKGTWMISMKVEDEEVWEEQVKKNLVSGFSIEGFFMNSAKQGLSVDSDEIEAENELKKVRDIIQKNNQ